MDNVVCSGNETSIHLCEYLGISLHDCQLEEAIIIQCAGPPTPARCLEACPVGQFSYSSGGSCMQCSEHCLSCSVESYRCDACRDPLYLMDSPDHEGQRCLSVCPAGNITKCRSN